MADLALVAARYLHILFAVLWMGAIVLLNVVFFPRLATMELPDQRAFMLAFGKGIARYGEISGTLAIAFGVVLYASMFRVDTLLAGTPHANVYLAALVLAVVVLLLGVVVLFPRMNQALRLLEGMPERSPPPPEFLALMRPLEALGMAAMILVLTILGLMIAGVTGLYA